MLDRDWVPSINTLSHWKPLAVLKSGLEERLRLVAAQSTFGALRKETRELNNTLCYWAVGRVEGDK